MSADDLADLYAADAIHELPFLFPGMPARYHGREQVRTAYRAAWAATDACVREVHDVAVHATADPEVVIAEQVLTGVLASTGEPFQFPGVLVLRVHDGLITHLRDYMDGLTVAHATGRLPQWPTRSARSTDRRISSDPTTAEAAQNKRATVARQPRKSCAGIGDHRSPFRHDG